MLDEAPSLASEGARAVICHTLALLLVLPHDGMLRCALVAWRAGKMQKLDVELCVWVEVGERSNCMVLALLRRRRCWMVIMCPPAARVTNVNGAGHLPPSALPVHHCRRAFCGCLGCRIPLFNFVVLAPREASGFNSNLGRGQGCSLLTAPGRVYNGAVQHAPLTLSLSPRAWQQQPAWHT